MGGFNGFHSDELPPIHLTNDLVENIHHEGGTILRSSRGGFDMEKILKFMQDNDIQQLFVIGGDGTHRGAYSISEACLENNLNVAVAGIPKTIDNGKFFSSLFTPTVDFQFYFDLWHVTELIIDACRCRVY